MKLIQIEKDIKLEDIYIDDEYGTITLYFTMPNDGRYKEDEADSMEISIECPIDDIDVDTASCMISPTKDGSDYDWDDIDLEENTIDYLLNLYDKDKNTVFTFQID